MQHLSYMPIDVSEWHNIAVDGRDGASVEFLGIVRAHEDDQPIAHIEYEAYEPMAERLIAQFIDEATHRWSLHRVYLRHRLGRVAVGELAVLIGVQASHRDQAFEACRFLIDSIKRDAPIWKHLAISQVSS
jgi:molybdopterin synthase catalytic subunit